MHVMLKCQRFVEPFDNKNSFFKDVESLCNKESFAKRSFSNVLDWENISLFECSDTINKSEKVLEKRLDINDPKFQKQLNLKKSYIVSNFDIALNQINNLLEIFEVLDFVKYAFEITPFNSALFKFQLSNGLRLNVSKPFNDLESEGIEENDVIVSIFYNKKMIVSSAVYCPEKLVELANQTLFF